MSRPGTLRNVIASDMHAGHRMPGRRPYDGVREAIARVAAEAALAKAAKAEPSPSGRPCRRCGLPIAGENASINGPHFRCRNCNNARRRDNYQPKRVKS